MKNITPDKVEKLLALTTPGPWEYDDFEVYETTSAHGDMVADCGLRISDAKLIAAIPDIAKAYLEVSDSLGIQKGFANEIQNSLQKARERIAELEAKLQRYEFRAACTCLLKRKKAEPGSHHEMRCRNYVGPLTHKMRFRNINETFDGYDYDCTCGSYYRQGGFAGHGPEEDEVAEPVCRNADQDWRGPR